MGSEEFAVGRSFLVRVEHDSDFIKFVSEFAKQHGIITATFMAIGAFKHAKLGFYDQTTHKYKEETLATPQELASCIGNISTKENETFVHAHAVLSDTNGNTTAGHLLEGKVFAAEIHLTELTGKKIQRKKDTVTELSLWDI